MICSESHRHQAALGELSTGRPAPMQSQITYRTSVHGRTSRRRQAKRATRHSTALKNTVKKGVYCAESLTQR
jgi:hypothetical protein